MQDRHRKQINASLHASTFRPHNVHPGEAKISEMFTSRFHIEYAGARRGIDVDHSPASHFHSARTPLKTKMDNSFEFVNEGPKIIALNKKI